MSVDVVQVCKCCQMKSNAQFHRWMNGFTEFCRCVLTFIQKNDKINRTNSKIYLIYVTSKNFLIIFGAKTDDAKKTYPSKCFHIALFRLICLCHAGNLMLCIRHRNQLFDMSSVYRPVMLQIKKNQN